MILNTYTLKKNEHCHLKNLREINGIIKNQLLAKLSLDPPWSSEPLLHCLFNHVICLSLVYREPRALHKPRGSLATCPVPLDAQRSLHLLPLLDPNEDLLRGWQELTPTAMHRRPSSRTHEGWVQM